MSALLPLPDSDNFTILVPDDAVKDDLHRLTSYVTWLDGEGAHWASPNLAAYRDYLLNDYTGRNGRPLSATSVKAHLATVRGRYKAILRDNRTRDVLYSLTPAAAPPSDRKAFVDETLERLRNAVDPDNAPVKTVTRQDTPDAEHLRLTSSQASMLLAAPGVDSLRALRDTAVIGLMLCTGIREAELCALDMPDLRQQYGGTLSLHVRKGKGCKERLIPYGDLEFVLAIVDAWLKAAGIEDGAVIRGFYKGGRNVRKSRLTVRAINQILDRYPIMLNGMLKTVNPHDLRRTYARRLYEAGVDLLAIRDNLGHADTKTTLKYIGPMDADSRKPPAVYMFDLSKLINRPLV